MDRTTKTYLLSDQHFEIVMQALAEVAYRISAPIISTLGQQRMAIDQHAAEQQARPVEIGPET